MAYGLLLAIFGTRLQGDAMIHFRYHLVSLIAVFLALAIGVAMGATVIDRAIVDALRTQVSSAERRADQIKRDNDELKDEQARNSAYTLTLSKAVLKDSLSSVRVQVIAGEGLDKEQVQGFREELDIAGATVNPILWVARDYLSEERRATELEIIGAKGEAALWKDVAAELSAEPEQSETSSTEAPTSSTSTTTDSVIEALLSAEIFEQDGDAEADSSWNADILVVLGGPTSVLHGNIAATATAKALPTVLGELWNSDGSSTLDRGNTLVKIRNDDKLRSQISTVDSLEREDGGTRLALVCEETIAGRIGQYGYDAGARDGLLPEPA